MIRIRYALRGADLLVPLANASAITDAATAANVVSMAASEAPDATANPALECPEADLSQAAETFDLAMPEGPALVAQFNPDAPAPPGHTWLPLRSALRGLPENAIRPAARAMAYANWRAATRFCGRCGAPNADKTDETARRCTACAALSFPRISPAILAAVRKGDRLLLARNAQHRHTFWSLVAGFVEPGETFEECVQREVREEVGIEVAVEGYLGSQPWPFPDQLMLGFAARWVSGDLRPDGVEIAEAGWFGPDDHPPIPGPGSLSRRLIDRCFRESGPA